MQIFFSLLLKLIPLYLTILLGFVAGKYLHVKKESIASLVIYLIAPVIFFNGVYSTVLTPSSISLPIIVFIICCAICLTVYFFSGLIWKDATKNILGFMAPDGNNGYFGLPVAILLFPSHMIGLYIFAGLGMLLYENTLGFFIAAKGNYSIRDSLRKLLKLPLIYAVTAGLIVNLFGINLGTIYSDMVINFKGAYTILGMMIIGLGLAGIKDYKFDLKFTATAFLAKFLIWPLLVLVILAADQQITKMLTPEMAKVLILLAIVPLAANTVAFATLLKIQPEKVAFTVLLSTLFALGFIPLMAAIFLK